MKNPFSLTFGKEPLSLIGRDFDINEIKESFTEENPGFHVYMITGVRGSGKTVLMTSVSKELQKEKDWIIVDLNPNRDLLNALAAELSNHSELLSLFKDAKINLSLLGFGIEIDGVPPITDLVVALDRMLARLTQKGKKVLITIDEVTSNQNIKEFVSQFQIYLRKNYNIFLLMTGLYENISDLQNEKTLTFLYRAPKVEMSPLNIRAEAKQYKTIFSISDEEALSMANITCGYPYAYQVLGYICYKKGIKYTEAVEELDQYLAKYVYDKIWSELSAIDQKVLFAIAVTESGKVEDIRSKYNFSSNQFTVYRKRLLDKGLIKSPSYGHLSFILPRFREYVCENIQDSYLVDE